ncbi:MAG: nuclear transport factor 2 family protein [Ignavibacteriaceae bacterium]
MKASFVFSMVLLFFFSCGQPTDKNILEKEIFATEKSFEKMCAEKGVAEAFYFFADDSAVIKRENDTLIIGKENIKNYHNNDFYKTASVKWAPDFIDVSNDGSMAYTYGKYIWTSKDENGNESEFKGVFHTVWKRQKDNSWKYVWD